ncbi:NAD(P)/FAD-dependent oxidoreductase [Glutamicibacter creatinolyticus]|uniref:NAD(P)/FAD-dependent oxidoreductase n=1 Tax=Glutamicibacter creatinolyticus TaxID=162496 RepID=UPI0033E2F852
MKAIVIGAGVLGSSITYQLAKRGVNVTVVDKGLPGDAASAASFAWLNSNTKELRSYHDLNVMSISEWSAIARELGTDAWLHQTGNLHVVDNAADVEAITARIERLNSYGYAAMPIDPKDLTRIDPLIRVRDEYQFGVFFPGEGHITVPLVVHDLLKAAKALGAKVLHSTSVSQLIADDSRVSGVQLASGEALNGDLVIVAAGAGIGDLLRGQGVDVRTKGTPGITVTTSPGSSNISTMLHLPGLSVRPDTSGRIVVRSSAADEQIDFDNWVLPESAVQQLFEQTAAGIADVDSAAMRAERVQIASRPYPFDGLPVVGNWDGVPGLYVTTMHSGVTLGAIVGRLAAEEIVTGKKHALLEGFRPGRVIEAAKNDMSYFDPYALEGEKHSSR